MTKIDSFLKELEALLSLDQSDLNDQIHSRMKSMPMDVRPQQDADLGYGTGSTREVGVPVPLRPPGIRVLVSDSSQTLPRQLPLPLHHKGNRTHASRHDSRPTLRIASFGLAYKFQRLLEIVVRHSSHNPYRFEITDSRAPEDYEIIIVDMTIEGGHELVSSLRRSVSDRPIIKLGRRNDKLRDTDELLLGQFSVQLLLTLNRAAQISTPIIKTTEHAFAKPVALRTAKFRGLVIDDSETVRRQLSRALHYMGIETEAVGGAQEALDILSLRKFDLIFCDVTMPGGANGFELTKTIKRDPVLKGVPIIMITSRGSPFDLFRGALAGCDSYLVKPVSLKRLREVVDKNLTRSWQFDIYLEGARS
jgi:CheY-like chemotaxis protein